MILPDFLVLGAQKSGSTWINDNLKQHPDVFMPRGPELQYFNRLDYNDTKVRAHYVAQFKDAEGYVRVGEKTPGYFWSTDRARSRTQPPKNHNEDIPGAVRAVLGDNIDFIISLRHPVWRAVSAFGHHIKQNRINSEKTLREVAHTEGIMDIGFYGAHLKSWFDTADPARFEVLIFEDDIISDPEMGFRKLCRFLKINDEFVPPGLQMASNAGLTRQFTPTGINVSGHSALITSQDIEFLLNAYSADIALTKTLLNRNLASWDEETDRLQEWCKATDRTLST